MFYHRWHVLLQFVYAALLLFEDSEEICGRPFHKPILLPRNRHDNRISNGIEARKHSHPWLAFILAKESEAFKTCGGSLIDWKETNASDFVLTAAHCVIATSYFEEKSWWEEITNYITGLFTVQEVPLISTSGISVMFGMHEVNFLTLLTATKRSVLKMAIGEYNKTAHANDIALLKLDREIPYSQSVQGICLPGEKDDILSPESICLVAGWGLLASGAPATTLQQFQAYVTGDPVTNIYFQPSLMICTQSNLIDSGVRKGDSGGALVCMTNETYTIQGVISFGFQAGCSAVRDRQAFTKVTRYLPWLKNTIALLNA